MPDSGADRHGHRHCARPFRTIALIIGLVAANLWRPGAGMNIDLSHVNTSLIDLYVKQTRAVGVVPFLMSILPDTFVSAFNTGNVLQVLCISVLCGFALIGLVLILLLTSKGAAGISGTAFVVLAATLSAHQVIPVASVTLISAFTGRCRRG